MTGLRVVTYNLLAGEADDAARFEEATLLLRAAAPDVLALNECQLLAQDDGARLQQLAAALDMQGQLAVAGSGYHVALLLRAAIVEDVQLLSEGLAHAAVVATVRVRSYQLRVIAAHLDPFSAAKRLQEVSLLAGHLSSATDNLVLGDLNALSPGDVTSAHPEQWVERYRTRHLDTAGAIDTRALELLELHGLVDVHASLHGETLPTRPTTRYARPDRPAQRLDYIFASGPLARAARVCEPYKHVYTETASDHRPLYADFS